MTGTEFAKYVKVMIQMWNNGELDNNPSALVNTTAISSADNERCLIMKQFIPYMKGHLVVCTERNRFYNFLYVPGVTRYTEDPETSSWETNIDLKEYLDEEFYFLRSLTLPSMLMFGIDALLEMQDVKGEISYRVYYYNTLQFIQENKEMLDERFSTEQS